LLYRSEISPESARPLFERGLKFELRGRMADKDYPNDLDQFVSAVIALDNRLYRVRTENANRDRYVKQPFRHENRPFKSFSTGVAPMDIGQVVVEDQSIQVAPVAIDDSRRILEIRNMEKELRRQVCFDEGRCFYCKELVGNPPSHTASTCPKKVNRVVQPYSPFEKNDKESTYSTYVTPSPSLEVNPSLSLVPNSIVCPSSNTDHCPDALDDFSRPIKFMDNNPSAVISGILNSDIHVELLVDSGAEGLAFMDESYAVKLNLPFS